MTDLTHKPLSELRSLLADRQLSSRELTEACLAAIETGDGELHAFLYTDSESALQQADAADVVLANEALPGPLTGIPLAIKDVLAVEAMPLTCGSRILEGFVPPFSATSVERLSGAGAVLVGKTNTDEFAMGSSTENSAYGVTHNPWDLERVPGGSSGGSAAAVAGGLVPAAIGSDTGGSIRQPAAFCGVTGLKPTYGRVSRYGLVAYGSSLDCVGPITRTAQDAALLFGVLAGHDPLDATTSQRPVDPALAAPGDIPASVAGLRIGLPEEYFIAGIQPEVEAAVRAAIQTFADLGAEIVPVRLPHTEYALPVYYLIAPAEASANLARYDGIRFGPRQPADSLWGMFSGTRGEKFGREVKRRIMLGTYALSAGYYDAFYGQAQKVRTLIKRDFEQVFEQVDVIAAPVAPTTAFKIGSHSGDPLSMYLEDVFTLPANLAGVPGISFPVGFDSDELPVGMQLMGPQFGEVTLLQAAAGYQDATNWHTRVPTS
jgi:aspartyl-tRNA(Asn)/glutamyl-tRNA(Gln) amidotransferase subunit A